MQCRLLLIDIYDEFDLIRVKYAPLRFVLLSVSSF